MSKEHGETSVKTQSRRFSLFTLTQKCATLFHLHICIQRLRNFLDFSAAIGGETKCWFECPACGLYFENVQNNSIIIGAFGRGSEPQRKLRFEVGENLLIGIGRGVVHLVDDEISSYLLAELVLRNKITSALTISPLHH